MAGDEKDLISHISLMSEGIYEVRGAKPGPRVAIFCGVHGNERAGIMAVDALRQALVIDAGTVVFVYANLPAMEANQRMIHANLNRLFYRGASGETYEYPRAHSLMDVLDGCDALLDLHAYRAAVLRERAIPFAICEERSLAIAAQLPVNTVLTGFTAIQIGGSHGYMDQQDKVGICVELGAIECPEPCVELGKNVIMSFLAAVGCCSANQMTPRSQTVLALHMMYKKTHPDFHLARSFVSFEQVQAGEHIATENGLDLYAHESSTILFPSNEGEIGTEMFLLAKERASSL